MPGFESTDGHSPVSKSGVTDPLSTTPPGPAEAGHIDQASAPPSTSAATPVRQRQNRTVDRTERGLLSRKRATALAIGIALMLAFMHYRDTDSTSDNLGRVGGTFIAIVSVAAAFKAPHTMPLFAAAYLPFNITLPFGSTSQSVLNMTVFMEALVFIAWRRTRSRGGGFKTTFVDRSLIWLMALGLLSHTVASIRLRDLSAMEFLMVYKRWASPFVLYLLSRSLLRDRRDARALFIVVLCAGAFIGALTWHEGTKNTRGGIDASRVGGIMRQPNTMGALLVYYGLPLLAVTLAEKRLVVRGGAFVAFGVVVKAITHTFSRGANLALLAGILSMLTVRGPHYLLGSIAGTWAAMVAFPTLVPESAVYRMLSTSREGEMEDSQSLDKSSQSRLYMWRAGLEMVKDHPFLGLGLGRFKRFSHNYLETRLGIDPKEMGLPAASHNSYISTASEMGVPALLCTLFVFLGIAWYGYQWYSRAANPLERSFGLALMGMAIGILTCSMFGSRWVGEGLMSDFWLLAAALVTGTADSSRLAKRHRRLRELASSRASVHGRLGAAHDLAPS